VYFQPFFRILLLSPKEALALLTPKDLFSTNFAFLLDKTNWGKFGKSCFSSIHLTNFAHILKKFAKVSISQIFEKRKPCYHHAF
jgi:hypothetical protein